MQNKQNLQADLGEESTPLSLRAGHGQIKVQENSQSYGPTEQLLSLESETGTLETV